MKCTYFFKLKKNSLQDVCVSISWSIRLGNRLSFTISLTTLCFMSTETVEYINRINVTETSVNRNCLQKHRLINFFWDNIITNCKTFEIVKNKEIFNRKSSEMLGQKGQQQQ